MTPLEHARIGAAWTAAMRRGDFAAAWRATDALEFPRREQERAGAVHWDERFLLWDGGDFRDRRVLVRCNHGLGDTLQFIRFIPWISAVAQTVTVLVQPPLVPLLRGVPGFGNVRDGWRAEPAPEVDVEIEVMELAYAFRCTAETLPRAPYLALARTGALPRIGGDELQIGLLWAASAWDARRSIPSELLAPLGRIAGLRWHSLQQGAEGDAFAQAPLALEPLAAHTREIIDAAAAMLQLDLIISVDGMAAHLAGALGRPIWLLLQHDADWRWMRVRTDSPWYPTMRLFRQKTPGDWTSVIEEVAAALATRARPDR